MRFLIAVPVYNEQKYLRDMIQRIERQGADVLFVDDGSRDETPRILAQTPGVSVIRHETNYGYGQSLISAFCYARKNDYDWVITIDCDDQHEPDRIPDFIERARQDDADIVSGSRYMQRMEGDTAAPRDRRRINARVTRMLNERLGFRLTDAFCGFKAYRVEAVSRLRLTEKGYAFPLQFWTQVAAHALRVCELPVKRIYNDPERHFGGQLDDPEIRLRHYQEVFEEELAAARLPDPKPRHDCCVAVCSCR